MENLETGRSERIRTSDPLLPKQVRYQTALHSDTSSLDGGLIATAPPEWQVIAAGRITGYSGAALAQLRCWGVAKR